MNTPSQPQTPKKTAGKSDEETPGSTPTSGAGGTASSSASASSGSTASSSASASSGTKKDAIELLTADHREVDKLFDQFKQSKGRQQRKKLVEKIAAALTAHTIIEEELFYPACREKGVEEDEVDEAQVEHDTVKILISDLLKSSQDDDYYEAKVTVLSELVKHHVKEEEQPGDGLFARAKSAGIDMEKLGAKLQARKEELMSDEKHLLAHPPKIRSLNLSQLNQEYGDMSRYPTDRYRDEENRSGGGYRSAGRDYRGVDYDDENRGSSISRGTRGEFYRGDFDEDFGPNRGTHGQSDYSRSSQGYRDGDAGRNQGYRGGSESGYGRNAGGESYTAYGRNAGSESGSGFGGNRGDYSGQSFGSTGEGRDGNSRPGQRRIEQSGSGGRYRLDYERDNDSGRRSTAGRHIGQGGDDREYYQGTRYGSSQGGGRYRTEGDQATGDDHGQDRYYSGQGYGSTRGGDFGGRSAYGENDSDDGDYEGRAASIDRGARGEDHRSYERDQGNGGNYGQRGGRYEGSGPGFRGNR